MNIFKTTNPSGPFPFVWIKRTKEHWHINRPNESRVSKKDKIYRSLWKGMLQGLCVSNMIINNTCIDQLHIYRSKYTFLKKA